MRTAVLKKYHAYIEKSILYVFRTVTDFEKEFLFDIAKEHNYQILELSDVLLSKVNDFAAVTIHCEKRDEVALKDFFTRLGTFLENISFWGLIEDPNQNKPKVSKDYCLKCQLEASNWKDELNRCYAQLHRSIKRYNDAFYKYLTCLDKKGIRSYDIPLNLKYEHGSFPNWNEESQGLMITFMDDGIHYYFRDFRKGGCSRTFPYKYLDMSEKEILADLNKTIKIKALKDNSREKYQERIATQQKRIKEIQAELSRERKYLKDYEADLAKLA